MSSSQESKNTLCEEIGTFSEFMCMQYPMLALMPKEPRGCKNAKGGRDPEKHLWDELNLRT